MKSKTKCTWYLVAVAAAIGIGGCSGMSRQDRNTLLGAGVGAAAGNVLSDGSTMGTLGGAAAGGVLGRVLTPSAGYSGNNGFDDGYRNDGNQGDDNYRNNRSYNGRSYNHDRSYNNGRRPDSAYDYGRAGNDWPGG